MLNNRKNIGHEKVNKNTINKSQGRNMDQLIEAILNSASLIEKRRLKDFPKENDINEHFMGKKNKGESVKPNLKPLDQCMVDAIERMIVEKYEQLMAGQNMYSHYKTIAGIVKSIGCEPDSLEVISIGTGSKFVDRQNKEFNGFSVNDCHAEIIARRGFMLYLYDELNKCVQGIEDSIFERPKYKGDLFQLKNNLKFHLYISTAPCGDIRIHSHPDGRTFYGNHPSDIPEGYLRTKGACYMWQLNDLKNEEAVKTGTCLMSCSDKILRWNVLGIQGALLATFMNPIYLSTVIFGELLVPTHTQRAMYGRIENNLKNLPKGYKLNKPNAFQVVQSLVKLLDQESPKYSVNWSKTCNSPEIVQCNNGKIIVTNDAAQEFSRISKHAFLNRYVDLCRKLRSGRVSTDYLAAKLSSKAYKLAKDQFLTACKQSGMGGWNKKYYYFNIHEKLM